MEVIRCDVCSKPGYYFDDHLVGQTEIYPCHGYKHTRTYYVCAQHVNLKGKIKIPYCGSCAK